MAERARRTGAHGRRRFLRRLGASVAASLAVPGAAAAQARKPAARPSTAKPPVRASGAKPPAKPTPAPAPAPPAEPAPLRVAQGTWPLPEPGARVDLAPASWIWLPGERTLANTFVLFRRELELARRPHPRAAS